ncbi:MAG: heat-shock protein [Ramlibacter sp.]|nr:heat-shock protein [Ramlibacter sp.]
MSNAVQTSSSSAPANGTNQAPQPHVRVDGETLVLEATAATAGPENLQLVHGEAQIPTYRRQFTLSRELDASRIEAQLRDGMLRLTIPKAEEARPRRIQVQVG